MRVAIGLIAVTLAGCEQSDPVEAAENEVGLVRLTNDTDAVCAAEQKLVAVLLKAQRKEDYLMQKRIADQSCLNAELERRMGI